MDQARSENDVLACNHSVILPPLFKKRLGTAVSGKITSTDSFDSSIKSESWRGLTSKWASGREFGSY